MIRTRMLGAATLERSHQPDLALALCDGDAGHLPPSPRQLELQAVDMVLVRNDDRDFQPSKMLSAELGGPPPECLDRGLRELAQRLGALANIREPLGQAGLLRNQLCRQLFKTLTVHALSVNNFRCYTPPAVSRGKSGIAVGAAIAASCALLLLGHPSLALAGFFVSFGVFCFQTELSLNWQIAIGSLLGVGFGLWLESSAGLMGALGGIFISALKMLIAPMVLLSIAHGIARMGDARELGRLGARTVLLYLVTMAFAVATGLVIVNLVQPGADSDLLQSDFFREAVGTSASSLEDAPPLGEFLLTTLYDVLANPFASIAAGKILPIVVFSILFGIALLQIGSAAQPLVSVLGSGYAAIMRIIGWVIRIAPLGIAALLGNLIATIGFRDLIDNLLAFFLVVIAGTLFHAAVTLPLVALFVAKISPLELFRGIREALAVAFTTSSSTATLPITTRCVETNLNVPSRVSSFVLPLGATVNMDGTALYEAIAAVFVATLYGIDLSLGMQLVIVFVAMATAIGAPGIPSAGMVTMMAVLESVGLPVEAVGILLTVDRFLDTFRTMANVEGDAVVAVCVARLPVTLPLREQAREQPAEARLGDVP